MKKKSKTQDKCVKYHGKKWLQADLPSECQPWELGKRKSIRKDRYHRCALHDELRRVLQRDNWKWPKRLIYFFSDLHADTDAFIASLVASGGIKKTGPRDKDFKLTKDGQKALFVIGGDCFDKGPSSIRLLQAIRLLMKRKADVRILAGNHDVRMMLGMKALDLPPDPRTDHFFIRMGPKVVPFLKEVYDRYLDNESIIHTIPGRRECRRKLFPSKRWFNEFPRAAAWVMPDSGIDREMKRLKTKMERFENDCLSAGMTLRMAYAAAKKWQRLFLHPKGEFYWFFEAMQLAYREASFLFIHAGLDDQIAQIIDHNGIKHLNREFRNKVKRDLFDFYYGPLANTIRTKYREVDRPLTLRGVESVRKRKIHAIVHGHLHLRYGQRITLRKGMINFECDATLDRNTRQREGVEVSGAAVTIIHPDGSVKGISADYPFIKVFKPSLLLNQASQ
ncbi:MAG: metallophosphoesterase family protein [Pseudomonadota bacterium]